MVAPSFYFFSDPCADTRFQEEQEPPSAGALNHGGGKIVSTELAVVSETVEVVTMDR